MRAKIFSLFAIYLFISGVAFADDHGRKGHEHDGDEGSGRREVSVNVRFEDEHRRAVREYYGEYRGDRCPPGLAKKDHGCMPPGQARRWHRGERLPPEVVYYEVPPALIVRLPPLPNTERYVRVGGDILLLAAGTGMVLDAIEDLGRL